VRAELRKERLRAEKLQSSLAQAEQERASLQGQSSAKTEEIEGLRQDLVALVAKVQSGETVLAQRTSLYEAAIAQVEKLSLKHAREKRNRRGAEEVVRGLDLQLAPVGAGTGAGRSSGMSPLRSRSRKLTHRRRHRDRDRDRQSGDEAGAGAGAGGDSDVSP
jgi:DNA repair exonuclease SbcCD ATPase subunit